MNDTDKKAVDAYRSFLLMSEIAGEEPVSQRELSRRLGIALGLVNSYLKNLVAKGYVRVRAFPKNRYAYLLTPRGLAEKSRLAYRHLSYFTDLYTITRQDYRNLFKSLKHAGVTKVVFCGVDEVAEIAYLSLREAGMELAAVLDEGHREELFFDREVSPLPTAREMENCMIVITSLKRGRQLFDELMRHGVDRGRICRAGSLTSISEHSEGNL
jgi:DNA-binding MarR family transcriptional regulator